MRYGIRSSEVPLVDITELHRETCYLPCFRGIPERMLEVTQVARRYGQADLMGRILPMRIGEFMNVAIHRGLKGETRD